MKKLLIYYLLIFLPLILCIGVMEYLNPLIGMILLFVYIWPYRSIVDTLRLEEKGVINRKSLIQHFAFSAGLRYKHFKELYWK